MTHPDWCGQECCKCTKYCELDNSMPCSPDCCNFDKNGEPQAELCIDCDTYKMNYIIDKTYNELDDVVLSHVSAKYCEYVLYNAENNEEYGHSWFPVCIKEFFENEYKNSLIQQKGHIRLCSLNKINEHINNYDEKYFVTRELGSLDCDKYGLIHKPELSPSPSLRKAYFNRWKYGDFIGPEKHIVKHGKTGTWYDLYELQFKNEAKNRADMVEEIQKVCSLLDEGTDILFVCFCPDLSKCHGKLLGEHFSRLGYKVLY